MSGYTIRKIGDLPPEEAALIRQDVAEASPGALEFAGYWQSPGPVNSTAPLERKSTAEARH